MSFKFNIQLFAEDNEGVEDDDPNFLDDQLEEEELMDEEESEEAAEDEEGNEEEDEGQDQQQTQEQTQEQEQKKVEIPPELQPEVNRIVSERLARDRKARGDVEGRFSQVKSVVQAFENKMGLSLPEIMEQLDRSEVEKTAQEYMDEYAMTEEEANKLAQERHETQSVKQRMQQYEQRQRQQVTAFGYNAAKAARAANPKLGPLIRQYEREIDAVSNNGHLADFDVALNYVLGEKVKSGELTEALQSGAEQKTMANIKNRGKTAPIGASQRGQSSDSDLTPEERRVAKAFGMTTKEYQKYKS